MCPGKKRWNNSSFLEIPGTLPRKCVLKDKESFFFCDGPYIHIIQSILSLSIWAGCYRSQDAYRSIIIQKYFKWETPFLCSGHRLLILLFLHKNWLWDFICMHVCTHREQKVSDTLELELKMVVTQYHGAGNWDQVLNHGTLSSHGLVFLDRPQIYISLQVSSEWPDPCPLPRKQTILKQQGLRIWRPLSGSPSYCSKFISQHSYRTAYNQLKVQFQDNWHP